MIPFKPRGARPALAVVLAATALIFLAALGQAFSIDQKLRSICADDQRPIACTPHGILDWELAFTAERARARLGGIEGSHAVAFPDDLRRSLELDRFIIFGYVGLLLAAIWMASKCIDERRRRYWRALTLFPVLAGALDAVENFVLGRQLEAEASAISLAWVAGAAAILKFLALLVPVMALTTLLVAWVHRKLAASRLEPATALSSVLWKERIYLLARRARAGLGSGFRHGEPVGLAFSGGGIRSATFNLGVLQALARLRLLPLFDYLSTVSGGGYIGSAFSSLLSINKRKTASAALGLPYQHEFGPEDRPLHSTEPESFPFAAGSPQLDALRSSSEFLVGRRRLFSMELLRTVGGPTFGFLYHLLHFGLFLVAAAAFYQWIVYFMVGKPTEAGPESASTLAAWRPADADAPLAAVYRVYFREVTGLEALAEAASWWQHPFVLAFVVGGLVAALAIWLCRRVVGALPDAWYERRAKMPADSRQEDSVFALVAVMVLAAIVVTWWWAAIEREEINISLPLVSYLGGGLVLLVRHAFLAMHASDRRVDRSRLAAREGAFVYLLIASLVLVLIMLPSLVFFEVLKEDLRDRPLRGFLTWLVTVVGARLFAGSVGGGAGAATGLLANLLPVARKVFLGAVFTVALLGSIILICVAIWTSEPGPEVQKQFAGFTITGPAYYRFGLMVLAAVLYLLSGRLNFNKLSLHDFYRDRVAEAYLRTTRRDASSVATVRDNENMRLTDLHGVAAGVGQDAKIRCVTAAPYHLVQTCLNLTAGRERAGRKTDRFIFSKLYCGSRTTGFAETRAYRNGETTLARAMTISGAAVSPAMGAGTFFAQSAAMTLLNVRLGQWMENPGYRGGAESRRPESSIWWPLYLLMEATASADAQNRLVYLSDGGHSGDNLGLCPLLERRCRLIIAVDAERDKKMTLSSFNEAVRQIRLDDGVEVEIDLEPLALQDSDGPSAAHCAIGKIRYPATATRAAATGWLILLKASMTGDESGPIVNYQSKNPDFPHQSTGDQFFDEAQFESYRELGEHVVETSLKDDLLHLVGTGLGMPERSWHDAFEKRLKAHKKPRREGRARKTGCPPGPAAG